MTKHRQNWVLGWLLGGGAVAIALAPMACGDGFSSSDCKASRTCSNGDLGGAAGQDDAVNGGEDNTSVGGNAGVGAVAASGASGGEGGAAPSLVGTPCAKDAECDDGDSCTGIESCVDGTCAAGETVKCPAGLVCSAAKNDACVFGTKAPWIVYTADADKKGTFEAYGVKVDLLGTMTPVKLGPTLAAGWSTNGARFWSPDGSATVITTTEASTSNVESYLVRFADGLPDAAIQLTKGMSASKTNGVEWSPSGKSLAISREDGVHVVDVSATGAVAQARVTPDGYDQVVGWIKNDNEVLYVARSVTTTKVSAALAVRNGGAWTRHPLVAEMGTIGLLSTSADRGTLAYVTVDAQNLRTFWTVETIDGAQPFKIAGPAADVSLYPSPNGSRFVLATTDKTTFKTTVFGGALSSLSAPPLLKQPLTIGASAALGTTVQGPWAPDSSRAAVFGDSAFGKQLVMYEPGAVEEWHALTQTQALQGDLAPLWSPDSKALALPTRVSATSNLILTIVAAPGYAKRDVDTVPTAGGYYVGPFSAGGEVFVYAKTSSAAPATDGYWVDLRKGVADAPNPVAIPGAMGSRDFASHGMDFVYVRDAQNCFYIDFAAKTVAEPVKVNDSGSVTSCSFQKLPK